MRRTVPAIAARPARCGSESVVDRICVAEKMDTTDTRHHIVLRGREAALTKRIAAQVQTHAKSLAELDASVSMAHLLHAAHMEVSKRERPLSDAETKGWV